MSREVKALKNFKPTERGIPERLHARKVLGEAFGTKKAKAAIRAHERNKMDVSVMEAVVDVLQDRIEEGTENLPTQGASQTFRAITHHLTWMVRENGGYSQRGSSHPGLQCRRSETRGYLSFAQYHPGARVGCPRWPVSKAQKRAR